MTSASTVQVTVVNHVAVDIAAPVEAVWQKIVASFVEGRRWRETGFTVTPIDDDPAAVLGGYRMRLERPDASVDERIVHVSERDDGARRLSLFVDFVSVPGGLLVFASYQALPDGDGRARYTIDCHTRMGVEGRGDVATAVEQMRIHSQRYLEDYLGGVKQRLEQQQPLGEPR
ncbi:SRPBCC family protein [Pelomonas sp. KK5]|uniref:SRPBCC family protein n=1 Tax=Pelomonas sp. KK5 TaxID=1855730 RepID=UPI00097C6227|nr:SRPBCC family protein [Pelomonas sp. KK5]